MKIIAEKIAGEISGKKTEPVLIAIDGRCGSGKSTLAEKLSAELSAPVIHMDDFYLPKEERTPEIMEKCGGNIDGERLRREVLSPLQNGEGCVYRPYDCSTGDFADAVTLPESRVYIVEGTYSVMYCPGSDIKVFLTVTPEEQLRRLAIREGADKLEMFRTKWIPMEERYFETFGIMDRCDFVFDTSEKERI